MIRSLFPQIATASLAAALLLVLCGCGSETAQAPAEETITIFVAASVAPAVEEISRAFEEEYGIKVQTNEASSATLAQQILKGADADVFVSANQQWADALERDGLVNRRRNVLANRMVVIVPADSQIQFDAPDDLLDDSIAHVAMADPESVPAGIYAKQALSALGLWGDVEPKVVAASNVRQALMFVGTGAAEAGIVYATDASDSDAVRVVAEFDPKSTGPIRYPMVVLRPGQENSAAERFCRCLCSPESAAVFRRRGFVVLDPPDEPTD